MKNKIDNKKNELPTLIFLAIITFCKGIDLTSDSIIYYILFVCGTALVVFRIINQKFRLKEILILLLLLIVCLIAMIVTKNYTPLFLIITIISMKGVDIRRALIVVFFAHLISFAAMIILSSAGIIQNEVLHHLRESVGYTNRYFFGYKHPNLAQMHLTVLIFQYYYLYGKKRSGISYIIWAMLSLILFCFTGSRTSLYISIAFILYHAFLFGKNKIDRIVSIISKYSFVILFIVTMLLTMEYNNMPIVKNIDSLLTGRIYYTNYIYNNYSPTLFGINDFGEHTYIDNSYFGLLYRDGILVFIIMLLCNYNVCKKWLKKKEYDKLVFSLFLNILLFTENYYLLPAINFMTLMYSDEIFVEDKRSKGVE